MRQACREVKIVKPTIANLNRAKISLLLSLGLGLLGFVSGNAAITQAHIQPSPAISSLPPFDWVKAWGGTADDSGHSVVVDGAGNVYVAGEFGGSVDFNPAPAPSDFHVSNGGQDAFVSKFGPDGTLRWARTWGGTGRDVANGLAVDRTGHVYISGPFQNSVDFNPDPAGSETQSSNAGAANNIYLSKLDPEGNLEWVKTWGPADGGAESYGIALDSAGYLFVVGDFSGSNCDFNPWSAPHDVHANHPGVFFDAYLSKFGPDGTFQWAKTWGGEGYDDGPSLAIDSLDNVYVGGMYASKTINFDPAGGLGGANHPAQDSGYVVDAFLSKFSNAGVFQWVKTWGGAGSDEIIQTLTVDRSNHVYAGGRFGCASCDFDPGVSVDTHASHGNLDAFISKFDAGGAFQWARTWGGTGLDVSAGLVVDSLNNVYAAGLFNSSVDFGTGNAVPSNGASDGFLSKFDRAGNFQSVKTWGGSGGDGSYAIARSPAGSIYLAGEFQSTVDFNAGNPAEAHSASGGQDACLGEIQVTTQTMYAPWITK